MIEGRLTKEPLDVRRVVFDLSRWVDPGEVVTVVSAPVVIPIEGVAGDTSPLTVPGPDVVASTQIVMMLSAGTPGRSYYVTIIAEGNISGRRRTLDLQVGIDVPPNTSDSGAPLLPTAASLPTTLPDTPDTYWNNGGVVCIT